MCLPVNANFDDDGFTNPESLKEAVDLSPSSLSSLPLSLCGDLVQRLREKKKKIKKKEIDNEEKACLFSSDGFSPHLRFSIANHVSLLVGD